MPHDPELNAHISSLLATPGSLDEIRKLLIANSRLPGPRGNLELIAAFARIVETRTDLMPELIEWAQEPSEGNNPAEFISCVACVALGRLHARADKSGRARIARQLRASANDPRWRVREAVAMGLQEIGEKKFAALDDILTDWSTTPSHLESRAIVAAIAHPPLLKKPEIAARALELATPIAKSVSSVPATERKSEAFIALRKGLAYALSVIIVPLPAPGFTLLEELLQTGDPDLRWIVKENLSKGRLTRAFPAEVARLSQLLADAPVIVRTR